MKRTFDPTSLLNKARQKLSPKVPKHPAFSIGDTVRVSVKVKEGDKTRLQVFEGMVIAKHKKKGNEGSFTVRKISYGIGVERVFPFNSPAVDRITVVSQGDVRRAKLYYLRALSGRKGRIKSEQVYGWTTDADTGEAEKSAENAGESTESNGAPEKKAAQA